MPLGHGVDLVKIDRIEKAYKRLGRPFLERIFTPAELDYCKNLNGSYRWSSLAGRYAGKEALAKALGTGIGRGVTFLDMEILADAWGKPQVNIYGTYKDLFESKGYETLVMSISHEREYAIASCILA